jgi:tRNA modification GTPase
VRDCRAALQRCLATPLHRPELAAEELRSAAKALGQLTGQLGVEEVLDVLFRDFCIGK